MVSASCESSADVEQPVAAVPQPGDYKSLADEQRAQWQAYSKVGELVAASSGLFPRVQHYFYRFFDGPVTWFHGEIN